MISIRKFVGYAGVAAGLSAALAIALSTQAGVASTLPLHPRTEPVESQASPVTLSAECTAAVQDLKAAFIADITEDRSEYAAARLNGGQLTESDSDSTEGANFVALWNAIRTACAPGASTTTAAPTVPHIYSPSATCIAALQALKAAWAQHPSTRAQWAQLQSLAQAARTACG